MWHRSLSRFIGVALLASVALVAHAQEKPREGLNELTAKLADKTRGVAKKLNQNSVRIGVFSPSGDAKALGNTGVSFMAELELALAGFVKEDAALELQGTYAFVADPDTAGFKVILVKAKLIDAKTTEEVKEFTDFRAFIKANDDIGRITGAVVSFKPDDSKVTRNEKIQKGLPPGPGKPPENQAHIHGPGDTLVSASKESEYAVEIRKKKMGATVAQKATLKNGLPFVLIDQGEVYEVRVLNFSKKEIAVSLSLDGIDQFTFSEDRNQDGRPRFSHWIVAPADGPDKPSEVLIQGWHKTADPKRKDNVREFLVTEYGQGAASKFDTRTQGKIGLITVGIAWSYNPDEAVPKSATETGFGQDKEVPQKVVKRLIDPKIEFIGIRYAR